MSIDRWLMRQELADGQASSRSELDNESRRLQMHEDPKRCGCGGGGWILSTFDVWGHCFAHFNGQSHPEDICYDCDNHVDNCECPKIAAFDAEGR